MEITFGYEVIGTYPVTVEVDEEELQEIGWYDEFTEEDKIDYLRDFYENKTMHQAECECEFSIGTLDCIQFDGKEYWVH